MALKKHSLSDSETTHGLEREKKKTQRENLRNNKSKKFIVKQMKKSQNLLMELKRLLALEDYTEAA